MPMSKESRALKYQRLRDSGVCPSCRKVWSGPQVMCDDCRRKNEEARKKRRELRTNNDMCSRCGKFPVIVGTKYCQECATKAQKYKDSKETKKKRLIRYHKVYKPILQARRIAYREQGLCTDCGQTKASIGLCCEDCYKRRRDRYERDKLKSLTINQKCNGDCANCAYIWCFNDDYNIELTAEEKKFSKELDKQATEDFNRWKRNNHREQVNAKNRICYNENTINRLEYIKECERPLTRQEIIKLQKARQKVLTTKEQLRRLEEETYE
jgi:hypothetical protein